MECCLVAKTIYSSSLAEEAIKLLHTIQAVAQPLSNDDDVDGNNHRISNLKLTLASELAPNELLCTIAELFIDTVGRGDERKLEIIMAEKVLSGPFQRHQQKLMEGDFSEDNLAYAQLMLKVGGLWLDHMAILEPHYQANLKAILERLIILISAEGCPIEEDTLITELVIFWSSFVEWALDLRNSNILGYDQCCQWNITSIAYTNRVIEAFLKKLQLPSSDLFLSWDKQTQSEFRSLRRDFRDFSASAYILLGTDMLENLVNYISRLWADQDWQGVEMALQCLKGIIENFAETEQGDASLLRFLSSPAFSNNNDSVPINIRQSNLELVADCSPFFERQSYAPMDILQWLFEALNHQGLSISSAKAISKICDSCRKRLSSNALALASLYCSLDSNNSQQNDVLEKLALAVGAVIQASWSESRNLSSRATPISALDEMLSVVFRHLLDSVDITTAHAKDQRISTLQCLVNLARSFRDIEHEIIDLEADQSNHSLPDPTIVTWISTRQEQFLSLLSRLLQNFPSDGDLMEMVCLLIRAGTTDDLDNPFRVNGEVFICLVGGYLEVTERPRFLLETTSRWLRPSLSWVKNTSEINQRQGIARSCLLAGMSLLGRMYNGKSHTNLYYRLYQTDISPKHPTDQVTTPITYLVSLNS